MPGVSELGGAAAGLSYEGALRDALAREETARRATARAGAARQPMQGNALPAPQQQAARAEPTARDREAARQMMA